MTGPFLLAAAVAVSSAPAPSKAPAWDMTEIPTVYCGNFDDTLEFGRCVMDKPVEELDSEEVKRFLKWDGRGLPRTMKEPFSAKWQRVMQYRQSGKAHEPRPWHKRKRQVKKAPDPAALLMAGFVEIHETEADFLVKVTDCSYDELEAMGGFIWFWEEKSDSHRFFMIERDPTYLIVEKYRKGARTEDDIYGTKFFGRGHKKLCEKKGSGGTVIVP